MNVGMKIAITAVCAFGGGFLAGWFGHKKVNDVQFEEIEEAEMAKIEENLKEKEGGGDKPSSFFPKTDEDLPTDKDKLRMTLQGKVSYLEADQAAKEKYAKIWGTVHEYSDKDNADNLPLESEEEEGHPMMDEEFDPDFLDLIEDEESLDIGHGKPPYPIELSDFYNERNEYDKITIDWYEPDTFVDENEQIIADLKSYFGDIDIVALFSKCEEDEDPDIRFIRNESYGTDYEVVRHHRSWMETTGTGGSD